MSTTGSEAVTASITDVLRNAPEWVRHDLGSREPAIRTRAEEARRDDRGRTGEGDRVGRQPNGAAADCSYGDYWGQPDRLLSGGDQRERTFVQAAGQVGTAPLWWIAA